MSTTARVRRVSLHCVRTQASAPGPSPAPADVAARWPIPGPTDDKYTQGVTGVAAGSATYPGAAVLASGAAVLATSGMVRYAGTAADPARRGSFVFAARNATSSAPSL